MPYLCLTGLRFSRHLLRLYNQHRQPRTTEDTLDDTTHSPTLETSPTVSRQSDHITGSEYPCALRIFTVLCYSDDAGRCITVKSHRPGHRYMKFSRKTFAYMAYHRL